MTITYTLALTNEPLQVEDVGELQNVVRRAVYRLTANNGATTKEWQSAIDFGPLDEQNFIPFAQLTEADVIAWIEADHADTITRMQQVLAAEFEASDPRYVQAPWLS